MSYDSTEKSQKRPRAGIEGDPDRCDAELIARIADSYRAPELKRAQQTRLDADLWERTERSRRRHAMLLPAMAATAIAGLTFWLMLPHALDRIEPGGEPSEFRVASKVVAEPAASAVDAPGVEEAVVAGVADAAGDDAWEYRVLFSVDPTLEESDDASDGFPADYRAIDDMFLAG